MAVSDLAPALLALGEIFHEANAIVSPEAPQVALEVRAFDHGSFEVILSLGQAQGIAEELVRLLSGRDATALANLIELIVGVGGVFALLKWLHRHAVARRDEVGGGITRLTAEDGSTVDVHSESVALSERVTVRRNVRKVVEPLAREGVDELRFALGSGVALVVESSDLEAFVVPEVVDIPITDEQTEMALAITVLPFTGGRKWRLSDGRLTFFADMADEEFLQRIETDQETFAKDDILRCRVRVRQWQVESGLKTEYQIVKVTEHLTSVRTVTLPLPLEEQSSAPPISSTDQA